MADFATIFVSLVTALSCYAGIGKRIEPIPAKYQRMNKLILPSSPRKGAVIPYLEAKTSLRSFLTSKGCHSLAHIVNKSKDLSDQSAVDHRDFSDFVSKMTESLCQDFPLYLNKISSELKAFKKDTR